MGQLKKSAEATQSGSLPVWCDHCRLRIAPYERRVTSEERNYHPECQQKVRKEQAA